jgi:hypothetical protein
MTIYTPGPWQVDGPRRLKEAEADYRPSDVVFDVSTTRQALYTVATVWGGGDELDAAVPGNARVLAAAPELLEELRAIVWKGQADWSTARALLARLADVEVQREEP